MTVSDGLRVRRNSVELSPTLTRDRARVITAAGGLVFIRIVESVLAAAIRVRCLGAGNPGALDLYPGPIAAQLELRQGSESNPAALARAPAAGRGN